MVSMGALTGRDVRLGPGRRVRVGGGWVIRVLIVDDHVLFRESLAFLLQREPDIMVSGQAGTLAEARGLLRGVDIALIDLNLPDGNGQELIRELHALNPHGTAL